MATNRAHRESYNKRLKRLQEGSPIEAVETLLHSIAFYFNNEIKETPKKYQTSLLFLGIHAAIFTISEALFGKTGLDGYKHFLEKFIDGETEDLKFSKIASKLHGWRNNLAHNWLVKTGHTFGYYYEMRYGWKEHKGVTYVNPEIYCEQYLNVFSSKGKIWNYSDYLTEQELEEAKKRIIKKYTEK